MDTYNLFKACESICKTSVDHHGQDDEECMIRCLDHPWEYPAHGTSARNVKCSPGYNANERGECVDCRTTTLPKNATFTFSCNWTCNNGYVNIGGECEAIKTCEAGTELNVEKNTCDDCTNGKLHSRYTSGCNWECNDGFIKMTRDKETYCAEKKTPLHCNPGTTLDEQENECIKCPNLPENAYYYERGSCSWNCNHLYDQQGNTCVYQIKHEIPSFG